MKHTRKTGVYQIRNTINGKRYIGSTAFAFCHRFARHKTDLRGGMHHSKALQRAWDKYGEGAFAFEILLVCDPQHCIFYEQICLDTFKCATRAFGYNCSPTAGSCLGTKHTAETRAKYRAVSLGRKHTPETKLKLSIANSAPRGPQSPDLIEKRIAPLRGRKRPPEVCAKIAAAHKGKKLSPAHCAKISAVQKGQKRSPRSAETRAKIGNANRGRKFPPKSIEVRKKLSAALRGKKKTPEHIAKYVESRRRNKLAKAINQGVLF